MNINIRLREERARLGLTQTEAAKCGSIGFTAYQGYERGDRVPSAETLGHWHAHGFDVLYIVTGVRSIVVSNLGDTPISEQLQRETVQQAHAENGLTEEEQLAVAQLRQLDAQDKQAILHVVKKLSRK